MPEVTQVLIDHRDKAIAMKLLELTTFDTAERKDFDDDEGDAGAIVAVLGITQVDGVQEQFMSNYIDTEALFEEGQEGAKAHSNVFEVPPGEEEKESGGDTNVAGWRRMFGLK